MRTAAVILAASCWLAAVATPPEPFDIVLKGGRVIDPETNLDAVRDVGIRGDAIAQVSSEPLTGTEAVDARGLVVAPGFIDLHQHAQSHEAYRLMALDGVTTALELEIGVPDVRRFVEARQAGTPVHVGAAASYLAARVRAWDQPLPDSVMGPGAGIIPRSGSATNEPASPGRLRRLLETLRGQIEAGALGVGMGLEYAPGAMRREVIEVFRLAAALGVPVFVHARSGGLVEPGSSIEALLELIGAAAISGAAVHVVHLNSTCMRDSPECLSMIGAARARGIDVTTEAYPYTAGMTFINSALFNPGWRERRGLDYGDLELPESGERLTRERFEVLHRAQEPRLILIHTNPEEVVDAVMTDPLVAVASDGLSDHPRAAGTHARVLARYVRDRKTLTLVEAVRKMSLLPAQRLEGAAPAARRLGRLQPAARADIVVFDLETIQDRATFRAPREASVGVRHVLVAGAFVVRDGRFDDQAAPGRALLREIE